MRTPFYVNTLIDVLLPVQTVRTPGELRGGVVLFPYPAVQASGRLSSPNVVLDTGRWLVHDLRASTLPLTCPSQQAAQVMADTWVSNVATQLVDPGNGDQVTHWCKWFADQHPDCATLTPLPQRPEVDAMTMAGQVWPQGTDAEAAGRLTTTLADVAAPMTEDQSEASPEVGQADSEITEAAS